MWRAGLRLRCCWSMDMPAQPTPSSGEASRPQIRADTASLSADCFLTFANHLVQEILVEYRIDVNQDADCATV